MANSLALKEIKKARVSEDIVAQLKALIASGKLHTGDQLPSERDLAEQFKVSRASVREAIRALESMGLLEARQGHGTYVATSVEALVQPLAASLFHEKDDLIDIFFLRKIIEPEIAQLASENATPEEINELEDILKDQEAERADADNPVRMDTHFHHLLARMAKNRVLERLSFALVDLLGKTRERYLQTEERKQKSLLGHRNILAAIQSGNGTAARQAMRRHLEDVEAILFKKKKEGKTQS